jgi:hypothetical protein
VPKAKKKATKKKPPSKVKVATETRKLVSVTTTAGEFSFRLDEEYPKDLEMEAPCGSTTYCSLKDLPNLIKGLTEFIK